MDPAVTLGVAVAGYLIGSISFARIVGRRVVPDEDLSTTPLELPGGATIEYGGVSATSIGARTGPKWGIVVGLADMLKAFIPVLAARLIWPDESYYLVIAVAVMVGHNYPLYYRFKGGRGQSPLYGGVFAVDPLAPLVTTPVAMLVGLAVREMLVGYTLGQLLLIPWFMWQGTTGEVIYAIVINVLFTIATWPEIMGYLDKRRAGEVKQIETWDEFKSSHPAMGAGRFDDTTDE